MPEHPCTGGVLSWSMSRDRRRANEHQRETADNDTAKSARSRMRAGGKDSDMSLKKRSVVWSYFSPIDKLTARCQVCDKIVSHCSNTSNLFKHLKTTHPESHTELGKRQAAVRVESPSLPAVRQKTLHESMHNTQPYPGTDL